MRALNARPLSSFPKIWRFLPQEFVPIERTAPAAKAPDGMVRIPANPAFRFDVHGIEIEGADDIGVDVQYPGDDSPRRHHAQTLSIPEFYIDKFQDEHTRGHASRRQLLSPARIAMVFPLRLQTQRTRQVPADRPVQRSRRYVGLSLCQGCAIGHNSGCRCSVLPATT
jgi:hypothetical protein